MTKLVTSRSVKGKATTSSSSSRDVATRSTSSLLGEPDDAPGADIRNYSGEELRAMRKAGAGRTRRDATEVELDESFWRRARLIPPLLLTKSSVHLRVDNDVLDWFRKQGKGHLTRMNHVLRAYYQANREREKLLAAQAPQQKKTARP